MTLIQCTVKPVLSSHSKIDKTKALKTGVSLVQIKSIEECSFCNTFDLHLAIFHLKTLFWGLLMTSHDRYTVYYSYMYES